MRRKGKGMVLGKKEGQEEQEEERWDIEREEGGEKEEVGTYGAEKMEGGKGSEGSWVGILGGIGKGRMKVKRVKEKGRE